MCIRDRALCDFNENQTIAKAIDFTRTYDQATKNNHFHHVGVYSYRRSSLERFINLPQSERETLFKLEQLRALDNEINIDVVLAESNFKGVDTEEDYLDMKKIMEYNKI